VTTALAITIVLTGIWEWHWRDFGAVPGYRMDDALWARQRRRIDEGEGDATVLIGSSRTLFDTQLPVWQQASGRRPIELSLVGNSPLFVLEDLAKDPQFTGRLVVGVTPDLFFSGFAYKQGLLRFYRKESPSQRVSKILSMRLFEPWLAFYDEDFALFTVLRRLPWPDRPGVGPAFDVHKIEISEADRNTYLWSKVVTDASYQALVRSIWAQSIHMPPPPGTKPGDAERTADEQITRAAAAVARLKERGVSVVFVREPSAGEFVDHEKRDFPRASTWDVLLQKTQAPGIHYEDFPELQGFDIPDWSHLSHESAIRYTAALYSIIETNYPPANGSRW